MQESLKKQLEEATIKKYNNREIDCTKCFHLLKAVHGSFYKASLAFQKVWMERP